MSASLPLLETTDGSRVTLGCGRGDQRFHKLPFSSDYCRVFFQPQSKSKGLVASFNSDGDLYAVGVAAEDGSSYFCVRIDPAAAAVL